MQEWDDNLNDRASSVFKTMEGTITRGIEEMLREDENLNSQADFNVTIVGFK
jgi:hypothetical protein